jgi:hypothetical protein
MRLLLYKRNADFLLRDGQRSPPFDVEKPGITGLFHSAAMSQTG